MNDSNTNHSSDRRSDTRRHDQNNDHNSDHSNNDNSDDSNNASFARMKKLFVQGHSISDSLVPWTKKAVTWAERIYKEERRAEYNTTQQQHQQQMEMFYIVGEETCKLNADAVKIRDMYEDWCQQLHQTKRMFAEGSMGFAPQISQWAYANDDECPSTTNQSNNNDQRVYIEGDDATLEDANNDETIQRSKALVKEFFAAADKISTSLCHWTGKAVSVAYQMNDLVRELGFFSRFSGVRNHMDDVRQW